LTVSSGLKLSFLPCTEAIPFSLINFLEKYNSPEALSLPIQKEVLLIINLPGRQEPPH
jgi:hypothetical protein